MAASIHDSTGQWARPGDLGSTSGLASLFACQGLRFLIYNLAEKRVNLEFPLWLSG